MNTLLYGVPSTSLILQLYIKFCHIQDKKATFKREKRKNIVVYTSLERTNKKHITS